MRQITFFEDESMDSGFRVDVSEGLNVTDTGFGWTIEEGPLSEWGLVILAIGLMDGTVSWQVSLMECCSSIKTIAGVSRYGVLPSSIDVAIKALTSHWITPLNSEVV